VQAGSTAAAAGLRARELQPSDAVDITAVNGIPIAGHEGPGSIADITVRKLLTLQGLAKPQRIISQMSYPGAANAITKPRAIRHRRQLRRRAASGARRRSCRIGAHAGEWTS
jgi:hypothetical protein